MAESADRDANETKPLSEQQIVWRSEELFRDQREVFIRHGEEVYRLRITRQGKLILNK